MKDLIFEKRADSLEVEADSNLVKLQQKILDDVMGPLFKIWTTVQAWTNCASSALGLTKPLNCA